MREGRREGGRDKGYLRKFVVFQNNVLFMEDRLQDPFFPRGVGGIDVVLVRREEIERVRGREGTRHERGGTRKAELGLNVVTENKLNSTRQHTDIHARTHTYTVESVNK